MRVAPGTVRIASRQSDLARIQAYLVAEALRRAHPGLKVEHQFRESLGDLNQTDPLWQMPERGVFTQDFLASLVGGETDLVVHSWKDLPVEDRPETEIVATLPRADARDVLLVKRAAWSRVAKSGKIRVYSSSPRRARNLDSFLRTHLPAPISEVAFVPVRGNVPTRLRKLIDDDAVDGLVVAKAALDRLLDPALTMNSEISAEEREKFAATATELGIYLRKVYWMVLPLAENPTAAAQGALAIEIRKDRADLRKLLAPIHCEVTARTVRREREILRAYGGGCHQKIGVTILSRMYGELCFLRGETDDGRNLDLAPIETASAPVAAFLDREALPLDPAALAARFRRRGLWIARANALPADCRLPLEQIVWAAGPETWAKLAARGVWVNGSAEGLGESESPAIAALAAFSDLADQVSVGPEVAIRWTKLTHEGIPGLPDHEIRFAEHAVEKIPTYRLVPRAETPRLDPVAEYFWTSGSNFLAALRRHPEIAGARHRCGPGKTYPVLRELLGPAGKIEIQVRGRMKFTPGRT